MGYFLHRLKDERSLYRGREIRGGTHSFLRHKLFTDVSTDLGAEESAALTYRLSPNEIEPQEYPLKVSLALTYTLRGEQVHVGFRFQNHEPELTAHLEFGLHPGFAATSFDTFQLEMPAGRYRRWFSPGNYLTGETEEINHAGGEMPFDRAQLRGSYILEFLDVPDRTFVYRDPPSGRRVSLDFSEVPYVTLWSDGDPFLCVEPCWGLTDRHEQRAFEDKDGIQQIRARRRVDRRLYDYAGDLALSGTASLPHGARCKACLLIARHQIRIHLFHLLGDEAKLRDADQDQVRVCNGM